jgi:energy-converting hydrogenase Eha subunit E
MDITTLIGITGATIILIGFLLNQFGLWSRESLSYDVANVAGSVLLLWYSYLLGSVPFLLLNSVWLLVSARDVVQDLRR